MSALGAKLEKLLDIKTSKSGIWEEKKGTLKVSFQHFYGNNRQVWYTFGPKQENIVLVLERLWLNLDPENLLTDLVSMLYKAWQWLDPGQIKCFG